jgi:hypothetical protein
MSDTIRKRGVAKEILTILKDHSPLTLDMIQKMIEPPIQKKNLRQALGILKKKRMVDMVACNSQTFFYQINQSLGSRQAASEVIKCGTVVESKPLLRRQEWFHNEWCEFWSLIIKRAFPESVIVREHEIEDSPEAKSVLLQNNSGLDLLPDFLVLFPKTESSQKVSLAFEIERTRKSDARIQRKLKKYIFESHVDGLIYVCDSGRMAETIRGLYEKKVMEKAHKKRGYADHFFLFSDSMSAGDLPLLSFYNAKAETTSLVDWCKKLRSTKMTLRRDAQFMSA